MKTDVHFWSYLAHFFLEWELFQTKVVDKIKTHTLRSITFFSESRAVYEIMWKNIVELGKLQTTIQIMRNVCWITKATNTHSEYVILIAFPLQQWLHLHATVLRRNYVASPAPTWLKIIFIIRWLLQYRQEPFNGGRSTAEKRETDWDLNPLLRCSSVPSFIVSCKVNPSEN
jgi:hypothetical protein